MLYRAFVSGIEGGDVWRDAKVLKSVFSNYGPVLEVFLPWGKKVLGVVACAPPHAGRRAAARAVS